MKRILLATFAVLAFASPSFAAETGKLMSGSTIRPVRHSIPLSLSIVARPHMRLASYVPGELIPLPLSGSIPELPHVEKVLFR